MPSFSILFKLSVDGAYDFDVCAAVIDLMAIVYAWASQKECPIAQWSLTLPTSAHYGLRD